MLLYFKTEKSVEAKERLLNVMHSVVNENYSNQRASYLQTSVDQLKGNEEVKLLVRQLAETEKLKVKDVEFDPIIETVKNDDWFLEKPHHSFKIKMNIISIDYQLFHILDDKNFLCYEPGEEKEIKKITVSSNIRVFTT